MDAVVREYFRLRKVGARPWSAWYIACKFTPSAVIRKVL